MAPVPTCPNCGADLAPIALPGGHPPWACYGDTCQRGWWAAELEARGSWDPLSRSFADPDVAINAVTEHLVADIRGTSVTPDNVAAIDPATLQELLGHDGLGEAIRQLIAAHAGVEES